MRETLDIFRFVENLDFCSVTHESEIGLLLFMRIYMKTICSGECIVQLYPYSSSRSEWVRASYSIKKNTYTHFFSSYNHTCPTAASYSISLDRKNSLQTHVSITHHTIMHKRNLKTALRFVTFKTFYRKIMLRIQHLPQNQSICKKSSHQPPMSKKLFRIKIVSKIANGSKFYCSFVLCSRSVGVGFFSRSNTLLLLLLLIILLLSL